VRNVFGSMVQWFNGSMVQFATDIKHPLMLNIRPRVVLESPNKLCTENLHQMQANFRPSNDGHPTSNDASNDGHPTKQLAGHPM